MALFVRLVRALFIFGLIFASYLWHLGLVKVFRRWREDESGREVERQPAWLKKRRGRVDQKNARRLLHGMLKLRGVYIKLGQVLSIMGGFLPRVYGKELESLQDDVPPHPFSAVDRAIRQELGKAPKEVFRDIEETPIAAASLGQVHVAYLEDGTKVAVKVLYPGIRDVVRIDMRVIQMAMKVYKFFVPVQNIESVHSALSDLLDRETDYEHEADCMERMAENFAGDPDILFPSVVRELSTKDVLTMSFMEGIKISHVDELEAAGVDRTRVATRLVQSFYKQLFVDRFFHADPHPGNFLVQPGDTPETPRIVVLDFGAISEVNQTTVDGMIDVLRGFFEQNDELALSGIEAIGFVAKDGDRELLEKTAKVYFQKLLKVEVRTVGAIQRANFEELEALADPEVERRELRTLMKSVHYPDGWFFVERASVLMFWLTGMIDPELDGLSIGFPYILPLLAARTAATAPSPEADG